MQESPILGIDIAKKKFDVYLLSDQKKCHKIFTNDRAGFLNLTNWCENQGFNYAHACLEATGFYGEALADFLYEYGYKVSVVNPSQIKAFGRSQLRRTKNDKIDCQLIAHFCKRHQPPLWHPLPAEQKKLREWYRCLQSLKEQKRQITNQLENLNLDEKVQSAWKCMKVSVEKQINILEKEIKDFVKQTASLNQSIKNLSQISGVGQLTAVGVLCEFPAVENFSNVRQYVAYAGLNTAHYHSGSSAQGRGRVSKIGSPRARKLLYMPAIVAKNHNPLFKEWAYRLKERGKPPKVIVVAIMRKLLHIFFGMLKTRQPFDPNLFTKNA